MIRYANVAERQTDKRLTTEHHAVKAAVTVGLVTADYTGMLVLAVNHWSTWAVYQRILESEKRTQLFKAPQKNLCKLPCKAL